MLPVAVARSSSGGIVIRYVLPVSWMTSRLHIIARNKRRNSDSTAVAPWRILKLTHQGAASDLWAESDIYDCLVHFVLNRRE